MSERRPASSDRLRDLISTRPRPWLVGVDVDGTLAPIVSNPDKSRLEPGAHEALRSLAESPGVMVAVVSGRSLAELRDLFELPEGVILLGSHGAEVGAEVEARTPDEDVRIAATLEIFDRAVARLPGAWIEHKPLGIALHVREADPQQAATLLADLEPVLEATGGITIHRGKMVLEAAIRPMSKAEAFAQLRARLEPATTVFIGDDASDEYVFQSLDDHDVALKVGPGPTFATHRLQSPRDVVALLASL